MRPSTTEWQGQVPAEEGVPPPALPWSLSSPWRPPGFYLSFFWLVALSSPSVRCELPWFIDLLGPLVRNGRTDPCHWILNPVRNGIWHSYDRYIHLWILNLVYAECRTALESITFDDWLLTVMRKQASVPTNVVDHLRASELVSAFSVYAMSMRQ